MDRKHINWTHHKETLAGIQEIGIDHNKQDTYTWRGLHMFDIQNFLFDKLPEEPLIQKIHIGRWGTWLCAIDNEQLYEAADSLADLTIGHTYPMLLLVSKINYLEDIQNSAYRIRLGKFEHTYDVDLEATTYE